MGARVEGVVVVVVGSLALQRQRCSQALNTEARQKWVGAGVGVGVGGGLPPNGVSSSLLPH